MFLIFLITGNVTSTTGVTTGAITTNAVTTRAASTGAVSTSPVTSNSVTTSFVTSGVITSSTVTTGDATTNAVTRGPSTDVVTTGATTDIVTTGVVTTGVVTTGVVTTSEVASSTTGTTSDSNDRPSLPSDNNAKNIGAGIGGALAALFLIGVIGSTNLCSWDNLLVIILYIIKRRTSTSKPEKDPEIGIKKQEQMELQPTAVTPYKSLTNLVGVPTLKEITIKRKLGSGSYGDVFLGEWRGLG